MILCAPALRCAHAGDRMKLFTAARRPRSQRLRLIAVGVPRPAASAAVGGASATGEEVRGSNRISSASSLLLFNSFPSSVSFLRALAPFLTSSLSDLHLAEFPDPCGAHHGDSALGQLLDLLDSPAVINPASTRQQWLLL